MPLLLAKQEKLGNHLKIPQKKNTIDPIVQSKSDLYKYSFIKLDLFLKNKPANTETQEYMEKLLLDQFSDWENANQNLILDINIEKMSSQYKAYIHEIIEQLNVYYDKLYDSIVFNPKYENILIDKLNTTSIIKNNVYFKAILVELGSSVIISKLIYLILYITQNQEVYKDKSLDETGITLTSQTIDLGKDIVNFYIKSLKK